MKKTSAHGLTCDLRIPGDKLEQDRIQLEHNLLHTDLSLHLSSDMDLCDNQGSSVEYPRRNSGPFPFSYFTSPEQRTSDDFEQGSRGYYPAIGGGEEINPYAGETISTAAHHASALTLSAGLAGRASRNLSSIGAEYDPDRPLQDMIANASEKPSIFDGDPCNTVYFGAASEPFIVDGTANLDRILRSGHAVLPDSQTIHLHKLRSSASSSASDSDVSNSSRPKLSEAFSRVSFSPQRPQSYHSPVHQPHLDTYHTPSQPVPTPPLHQLTLSPKSRTIHNIFPSYSSSPLEVRRPPINSLRGSSHSQTSGHQIKEMEAERGEDAESNDRAMNPSSTIRDHRYHQKTRQRDPFRDIINQFTHTVCPDHGRHHPNVRNSRRKHVVQLPDVTGLTSAVESPAKPISSQYLPCPDNHFRKTEPRLLSTLSNVQSKLMYLESENGIAHRRIRELELELERCKKEVETEHTIEEEDVIYQHDTGLENAGRGKIRRPRADQERLAEVVEEKKALEALIATLRAHLTRLTAELSSHQQLLTELRSLRKFDHREVKKKSLEMEKLREEVERLAEEVEVLKAVVEEGLRERRLTGKKIPQMHATKEESGCGNMEQMAVGIINENGNEISKSGSEDIEYTSRNLNPAEFPDGAVRIDYAIPPSPTRALSPRYNLDDEHLLDRRKPCQSLPAIPQSNGRHSACCQSSPTSQTRSPSPALSRQQGLGHDESHRSEQEMDANRARESSPAPPTQIPHRLRAPSCRPATPIPVRPSRGEKCSSPEEPDRSKKETPFPQIRGYRLERLFFSVREHNSKTCTICCRGPSALRRWPSWLPNGADDADEGFVECSKDDRCGYNIPIPAPSVKAKGKQPDLSSITSRVRRRKVNDERKRLPPQIVLLGILRELEDDFTHYKSIYVELADEYKLLDAVSNVPKRNLLARHLQGVIDVLEQKGDQIASLHDLLTAKKSCDFTSLQSSPCLMSPCAVTPS